MVARVLVCDPSDDDYIDIEVSSYSNSLCHSVSSPPHAREFEFQMSSIFKDGEVTTSPADELFYKGKLLPLHLPLRLQMVEELLQNSLPPYNNEKDVIEEFHSTPLATTIATPTTATPFDSRKVSRELNPDEYNFDYPESGFVVENHEKSWAKKPKQSSLGSKLKASRAYLRSLFVKPGCSCETYGASTKFADEGSISITRENLNKQVKVARKISFGQIHREKCQSSSSFMKTHREKTTEYCSNRYQRRSFSVGIKRLPGNKSSSPLSLSGSSSFSLSNKSHVSQDRQFLQRCGSANSEMENPIQGAIAHCKQSQQKLP